MSWQDIPGWFGFQETYDEFVELANDGDTIVEIGVAFGRSLAYLSRKVIDSGKKVTIWGCDPWVDDWWMPPNNYPLDAPRPTWGGEHAEEARRLGGPYNAFCYYMQTYAPEELGYPGLGVFKGFNTNFANLFGAVDGDYGQYYYLPRPRFVMIDGNHNYTQVLGDVDLWEDVVSPGGILAGDDYSPDFPGVVRAVDERFPNREVRGTTWLVRT